MTGRFVTLQLMQRPACPAYRRSLREEKTDTAIFREMGELGLLGVTVDPAYGGAGAGHVAMALLRERLRR